MSGRAGHDCQGRIAVAVLVVAAACSSGSSNGLKRASGVATTPAHSPAPLASEAGAHSAGHLVVGTTVGADRALRGVGFAFSPSVGRLTAGLIVVDAAAGSQATMTWSEELVDSEHTLFAQQVALRRRGVVYATAVATGKLAEGVFRVHATVGSEQRDALFVISRLAGTPAVGGGRLGRRIAQKSNGEASAGTIASGETSVFDVPDPCAKFTDPEDVRNCNQWYGTDESNAPTTEPSGPTTSRPCSTQVPDVYANQELGSRGGFVDIHSYVDPFCTQTGALSLAASVNGAAPAVIAHGSGNVRWFGETCSLAGGSDLDGDVVHARLWADGSKQTTSRDETLEEFGPFPVGGGTPPEGTKVEAGQHIDFIAGAGVTDATRGIKSLVVRAQDGTELARAGRAQPAAACDLSTGRFAVFVRGSYIVPSPAPPVVELTVSAQTFDGPLISIPLQWWTRPSWSGTIVTHSKREYIEPGFTGQCTDTWKGSLRFVVDAHGAVDGSGKLDKSREYNCTLPALPPQQTQQFGFVVGGTGDAKQFTIHFRGQTALPKGVGTFGGVETLFRTQACAQDPGGGPPISLQLSSPTSAAGTAHLRGVLGCGGSARDVFTSDSTIEVTLATAS